MSAPASASADDAARKPRRARTATESLLSVVLVMEAVVVIFGALVIYGLRVVDPLAAFGGGAVLIVLLLVAVRLVRYPWGQWFGHALQLLLLATVFLEVLAGVAAAIFVGFWIWAVIKGRQLDAANGVGRAS
ncbi:DUF4233 domain-containing protein [Yonghaparkia sp. Root332]|uniref:DUF4233 domain-containing protein n=1 Tax=Yonghaparkia sp. Root332 TaxID=1736516 RepID=UPI000701902B|nr:DUF4233 domain-containing protein [Yonghaparkia sp. Root332]KQV26613.1 hypothetical protein ASC54_07085 [Yonghaparkia sp. Root332]